MKPHRKRMCVLAGTTALLFGLLACEPVFAIGWQELLLLAAAAGILLGPPLIRFLHRRTESRKRGQAGKK